MENHLPWWMYVGSIVNRPDDTYDVEIVRIDFAKDIVSYYHGDDGKVYEWQGIYDFILRSSKGEGEDFEFSLGTGNDVIMRYIERFGNEKVVHIGDEKIGIGKFLKISDELELHRFRGADFVKLIGRRPAKSGCKPKCYEIVVNRMADPLQLREGHDGLSPVAHLYVDGKVHFSIVGTGCSFCDVESMDVSALHRLVKRRKQANARRHRSRKRKQVEKMALNGVSE